MSDRPAREPVPLIGGQYLVDVTRPLPDAGGGISAFAGIGQRNNAVALMALRVDRHAPARSRALNALTIGIDNLLSPLAHGVGPSVEGEPGYFVICHAPPGPPLSAQSRPWSEAHLIELVLRPIAAVLEQMHTRGVTHRGIRPNNVFTAQPNQPVTLGAAWAAPPAMHQPTVFETAYSALCHPAGRGDGAIADDVYALGVLLVSLSLGRVPLAGLDHDAIVHRKLEHGDFAAIVGNDRLPSMLADLVHGMLAEEPEHRPGPALLRDPMGSRTRRVTARQQQRAQRALTIGAVTVWGNRTLALAMAREPDETVSAMRSGTLMYWLRRGLGDANLAVKLEELLRHGALDATADKQIARAILVMRAAIATDALMPLCWHGLVLFPDGLGSLMAIAIDREPDLRLPLRDIVDSEAQGIWGGPRDERLSGGAQRVDARQQRAVLQIRGAAGGLARLAYVLNPLLPCANPRLADRWVTNIAELAPALDAVAASSPDADLVEPLIAAFIGARSERALDQEVQALAAETEEAGRALATMVLLAEIQRRYHPMPMKGLSAWVVARAGPLVERWCNRERRTSVEEQLKTLASQGFLPPILRLLSDAAGHAEDAAGLRKARVELRLLDAELSGITGGGAQRAVLAARLGQEIAAGAGLAALALILLLALFG